LSDAGILGYHGNLCRLSAVNVSAAETRKQAPNGN
jgi:hypothetical protein